MDLRILGPLEVWDGSHQVPVDSRTQCALLALLAIHPNAVVSTDQIIDALWGDDPPSSSLQTLRYHVSKLRAALGDAAVHVVTRSPGYVLDVEADNIDVYRFEAMVAEGRGLIAAEPERAARVLVEALGMWRGSPLADFTYESFARGEIVRLEELRLAVVEDRVAADLASGLHVDLVGELEALTAEYPLRERLRGQLMIALYRSGRQAEALRACQQARDALGEIGIEPSEELQAIEEQVLLQDPLLIAARPPTRRRNLPERLSSFIGRDRDIEEVRHLVGNHRLVTLTGVGGVGKTSLAVEVARTLIGDYFDGVWFVATSVVAHADLIPERLARILGVPIRTPEGLIVQLGDYLSERESLFVFDGCERHIDDVAGLVQSLLSAAPRLRVIATSREPLEVVGESRFEVPLLDTDGVGADAVRLFEDRAGLVKPRFAITSGNVDLVARICRRVAGIPLAVELAAARLGGLSLDQIGQRLDDQMTLLARSRKGESPHGSLRAVLDWSHELLEPAEQTLFRRLAVFRGGATLEAAELVCADEILPIDAVFNLLARLVDVSLVVADRETDRFEMLDPVRQYAARWLDAAGETEQVKRRHAVYYRDLAQRAFDGAIGPEEVKWSRVCVREEPNHIAALSWALDSGESVLAVDTVAYLTEYWKGAGRVATMDRFLGPVLEEARKRPSRALVMLLVLAAYLEPGRGVALAEEALGVARELDDEYGIGRALFRLGPTVGWEEDFDRGAAITREAFDFLDRIGDPLAMGCLFNLSGMLVRVEDGLDEAEAAARELLERGESFSSLGAQAGAYTALGWVAVWRGDLDVARSYTITAMEMAAEVHNHRWVVWGGKALVEIELAAGNIDRAVAYQEEYGPLIREMWDMLFAPSDGLVQIAVGDTENGIATLLDALDSFAESNEADAFLVLIALAAVCTETDAVTSVRLYGATEAMRIRKNLAPPAYEAQAMDENCTRLRTALGEESYEREWAKGEAMTTDQVVAYARSAMQPEDAH